MKPIKLLSLLTAFIMTVGLFGISAFAEIIADQHAFNTVVGEPCVLPRYDLEGNLKSEDVVLGLIAAKNGTPSIDGTISDSEGWSQAFAVNKTNMNISFWSAQSACIIDAQVRFAWDDTNLYIAAMIDDPCYIVSTGDGTDIDDGDYIYNGDTFVFTIDPAGQCYGSGMRDEYNMWYYISNHENAFSCKKKVPGQSSAIEAELKGALVQNGAGWGFECAIPWLDIKNDTDSATQGAVTKDDLSNLPIVNSLSTCCIVYLDRVTLGGDFTQFATTADLAKDEGTVFTNARMATTPVVLRDSTQPTVIGIKAYGIGLALGDASGVTTLTPDQIIKDFQAEDAPKEDPTEKDTATESEQETTKEKKTYKTIGYEDNNNSENAANNANQQNNGLTKGKIIGIIVAAVAIVAAVVIIIVVKKKKGANYNQ